MAITFPTSPSLNDTHTVGNITWTWNGSSWTAAAAGSSYGDSDVATYLNGNWDTHILPCLLYTSPSPRDATLSRMPSSA